MSDSNLTVGTRVRCTAHRGRHRGIIARVLVPGEMYVVSWEGRGTRLVRIGNVVLKYPQEIVDNHLLDLTACEASKVKRA